MKTTFVSFEIKKLGKTYFSKILVEVTFDNLWTHS